MSGEIAELIDYVIAVAATPYVAYWIWLIVRVINARERRTIRRAVILAIASSIAGLVYMCIPRYWQ